MPWAGPVGGGKTFIALEDVAEESFVSFRRPLAPAVYDELAALCRRSRLTMRIVREANEYGTMIALVAAGMGLALVPVRIPACQWGPGSRTTENAIATGR